MVKNKNWVAMSEIESALTTPFVQVSTYATRNFDTLGQIGLPAPFIGVSV